MPKSSAEYMRTIIIGGLMLITPYIVFSSVIEITEKSFLPAMAMLYFMSTVVSAALFMMYRTYSLEEIGFRRITLCQALTSLIIGIVIQSASLLYIVFRNIILNEPATESYTLLDVNVPFIVLIFAIGIVPAIFEELLFRGLLVNHFKQMPPLVSMILSSALFAVMHKGISQIIFAGILGIVLWQIKKTTGSIFSVMLTHFATNSTAAIIHITKLDQIGRFTGIYQEPPFKEHLISSFIVSLIYVVIFLLCFMIVKQLINYCQINRGTSCFK